MQNADYRIPYGYHDQSRKSNKQADESSNQGDALEKRDKNEKWHIDEIGHRVDQRDSKCHISIRCFHNIWKEEHDYSDDNTRASRVFPYGYPESL